jgi:hypothetical protein
MVGMTAPTRSLIGGGICCVALLTGCHASASLGSKSVSQQTVEDQTATILADRAHQPVPTVTCPGDLAAKVGTTMTCQLTPKGSTERDPVHITVDSVSGGTAHWKISVGSPTASPSS